ncbi:DUF362 domain-containing protein [Candidatus Dojkabacteria bacterium]|nr:DUF362 domain-containing protein [Candidatus Dojkabacteria bacterium]
MSQKEAFQSRIREFPITTDNIIVKPNWISDVPGEFTEPEILDWLLELYPDKNIYIVESYSLWRIPRDIRKNPDLGLGIDLIEGKEFQGLYEQRDQEYLERTGNREILDQHGVRYVNVTEAFWNNECIDPKIIADLTDEASIKWKELFGYVPQELFDIRGNSTFVSLAKVKTQPQLPQIYISMATKNLFGLIPHPSCVPNFHKDDNAHIGQVVHDMHQIYTSIFPEQLWIAEGVKTMVRNYRSDDQQVEEDKGLLFAGKDAKEVDSEACRSVGIDPNDVPHLQLL